MAIAGLTIDLNARLASFEADMKRAADVSHRTGEAIKHNLESIKGSFEFLKRAFIANEAAKFFKEFIAKGVEAERTLQQLNATLEATQHAAGLTGSDIRALSKELSEKTPFSSEAFLQASTNLLRFRDIQGETFREGLEILPKLALAMGTDLPSAATALGRALEDPERGLRALRAVGINLTKTQKDLIEHFRTTGDAAAQAEVLFKALRGVLGETSTEGLTGATTNMAKTWEEFLKTLATSPTVTGVVVNSLGFLKDIVDQFDEDIKQFSEADTFDKWLRALVKSAATTKEQRHQVDLTEVIEPTDPAQLARQRADRAKANEGPDKQTKARREEAARQALLQAEKDAALLSRTKLAIVSASTKQEADIELSVLDARHERGLVSEKDFFETKSRLHQKQIAADLAANADALKAEQVLVRRAKPEEKGEREAAVLKLQANEQKLLTDGLAERIKNQESLTDGQQKLNDAIQEVNASLFEQQGQETQAFRIRQAIGDRQLKAQVTSNFGADDAASITKRIDLRERLGELDVEFASKQRESGREVARLALVEQDIGNKRATGQLGEIEALGKIDEARKAAIARLQEQLVLQEKLVAETKNPDQILAVQQLKAEIESLNASADSVGQKFRGVFTDSLTTPLQDLITGAKSAKDALLDFAKNVEQAFARIVSQRLAEQVFGGSGSEGIVGGAVGFLGKLFGGGGGATAGASAASFSSAMGNIMTANGPMQLSRFARGGIARSKSVSIFGEGSNPEAYVPLPDGRSIPVTVKGGGSGTVVNMTVVARDAESFRRSSGQVIGALNSRLASERARS